jgi:hypothetical protein
LINIENRLKHWSTGWTAENQGDSPAVPFKPYINYFLDKNVLEIGPGEGRQYYGVKNIISDYSIADISSQVLDCPVFKYIDRFLIKDYGNDFKKRFDLIHFWYVLHHVPSIEAEAFVEFIYLHLKENGIVMFNSPFLGFDIGAYSNDGVNTTPYTTDEIIKLFSSKFNAILMDGTKVGKSNGHIFIWRKK